ncbi:MAG: NAD(P)-binding domain-containing protein, partial [Bacteroidetes bacterium]|nr:NAD(P)-binding domain-containing protein [Bacteroidota bacterium]
DADDVQVLIAEAGSNASAARPDAAAARADVVALATPWNATEAVVTGLGDLSGKVLIDCTNPLGPNLSLAVGPDTSGAEQVAAWAEGTPRVVKAFNTTGAGNMRDADYGDHRLAMLLCGDDADAKQTVAELAETLGFEPVDNGPLTQARYLEAMAVIWIRQAYAQGAGPDFGFAVLRR